MRCAAWAASFSQPAFSGTLALQPLARARVHSNECNTCGTAVAACLNSQPYSPSPHAQVRCGGAPVTRLALTRDECTLFAATADGCLHVFDVRDRDAARFLT